MKNNMMQYKGYHARIEYDADDNIFVGEIIGINDVLAFHCNKTSEIEKKFHNCIDEYLKTCEEIGKQPEREYTGSFSVRVEPEEQRIAVLCAAATNISFNQYVGKALFEYNKRQAKSLGIKVV